MLKRAGLNLQQKLTIAKGFLKKMKDKLYYHILKL